MVNLLATSDDAIKAPSSGCGLQADDNRVKSKTGNIIGAYFLGLFYFIFSFLSLI